MQWLLAGVFCVVSCCAGEDASQREVLSFWFGEKGFDGSRMRFWFGGDDEIVDQRIRDEFEEAVLMAAERELDSWKETAKGRLALIILLDQFPRNMYRDTLGAYAFDSLAVELTLEGLAKGDDYKLSPIEKVFFYLPLEHSETLKLQNLSVQKYKELLHSLPDADKPHFEPFLHHAIEHQKEIAEHGKFINY